jgi:diguanylate cyclase (GGDEF)-like protein/PAS domain S-box-containing protein
VAFESPSVRPFGVADAGARSSHAGDWLSDSGLAVLPLRWRFRLVVLAFALPFLCFVVWTAVQQADMERRHIDVETRDAATLLASRFDDHVEQIDHLLATVARSIGSSLDDPAAIESMLQDMHGNLPGTVDNLALWGLNGRSIASLDRRSQSRSVDVSDRRYFKDAIRSRDLTFEGPTLSRSTGVMIIQFARPVFDRAGQLAGVLTMAMKPTSLVDVLDHTHVVSESALITVVNDEGLIVARSIDAATWIGKPVPNLAGMHDIFVERSGSHEEIGADGSVRLAGFATVGKWPWAVTVGVPKERVLVATSKRLLRHLGIGLVIVIAAYLFAGRVAASTTRPLLELAEDTERLQRGDLSHRSLVAAGGEIATLAGHFNRMAQALEERDEALASSRARLNAITDSLPAQIYYLDHEERYRFANAYRGSLPGPTGDQMLGRTVREMRGEDLYAVIGPYIRRALAGESLQIEAPRIVDGRTFHVNHAYVPDRDENGNVRGIYCFAQDITERKVAELMRGESERRLVTITDNLPAMICYVDDNRRFRFANKTFERWLRKPLDEVVGQPFDRLMPPELASKYDYYFLRSMQGEMMEYEVEVPLADGSRWLRSSFIPDVDPATGKVRGVYGMIHNVTKAKQDEQRLTLLAQFDTLTGIANRHQFNETLTCALAESRTVHRPLALMFLDIDHFKQVNDRFGHGIGDILLKEFAIRLTESVRPTDAVARLSGDEFVVLLEGLHADDEPQFLARKIIAAIEKPFPIEGHVVCVSTSIGIAMHGIDDETPSTLMRRADEALYAAKHAGRNTFRLAS